MTELVEIFLEPLRMMDDPGARQFLRIMARNDLAWGYQIMVGTYMAFVSVDRITRLFESDQRNWTKP